MDPTTNNDDATPRNSDVATNNGTATTLVILPPTEIHEAVTTPVVLTADTTTTSTPVVQTPVVEPPTTNVVTITDTVTTPGLTVADTTSAKRNLSPTTTATRPRTNKHKRRKGVGNTKPIADFTFTPKDLLTDENTKVKVMQKRKSATTHFNFYLALQGQARLNAGLEVGLTNF